MSRILDSEGQELHAYDHVMAYDGIATGSHLWRHDIFLDYDPVKFPRTPYLCAGEEWPRVVKIDNESL